MHPVAIATGHTQESTYVLEPIPQDCFIMCTPEKCTPPSMVLSGNYSIAHLNLL